MQIVPAWPQVACNMNKIDCSLPAATRVQFACNWQPLGYNLNAMAASRMTFLHTTGGNPDTICLGLAARRTLFLYRIELYTTKETYIA
jgi:hypothetical protein